MIEIIFRPHSDIPGTWIENGTGTTRIYEAHGFNPEVLDAVQKVMTF